VSPNVATKFPAAPPDPDAALITLPELSTVMSALVKVPFADFIIFGIKFFSY
jgi:hypothetical protein